jgi:hypothetical protein
MRIVFIKSKQPQPDNKTFIHCCVDNNGKFYNATGESKQEALEAMIEYVEENINDFCLEDFVEIKDFKE